MDICEILMDMEMRWGMYLKYKQKQKLEQKWEYPKYSWRTVSGKTSWIKIIRYILEKN